jgi:hypothetical protein
MATGELERDGGFDLAVQLCERRVPARSTASAMTTLTRRVHDAGNGKCRFAAQHRPSTEPPEQHDRNRSTMRVRHGR